MCPSACIQVPANGSRRSNLRRSFLTVFCTPAFLRLSRTIVAKSTVDSCEPSSSDSRHVSSSVAQTTRCGDRLSTVNGPDTRIDLVLVGLVVERLGLGVPGDGLVDLRRASCPP